jgi:hypothetical protein
MDFKAVLTFGITEIKKSKFLSCRNHGNRAF